MAWVLRAGLSLARRALVKKARSLARGEGRFRAERVCFGGHACVGEVWKGCAGLAAPRAGLGRKIRRRRRVRAARGVFSTRRRASGSSLYLRDARGARREFERPRAPRARRGGRARAQGRFPSRGDSVRSRARMARTAPRRRDLCRAGGAGHWQALFRRLPCPAGLFGGRKLRHAVDPGPIA